MSRGAATVLIAVSAVALVAIAVDWAEFGQAWLRSEAHTAYAAAERPEIEAFELLVNGEPFDASLEFAPCDSVHIRYNVEFDSASFADASERLAERSADPRIDLSRPYFVELDLTRQRGSLGDDYDPFIMLTPASGTPPPDAPVIDPLLEWTGTRLVHDLGWVKLPCKSGRYSFNLLYLRKSELDPELFVPRQYESMPFRIIDAE